MALAFCLANSAKSYQVQISYNNAYIQTMICGMPQSTHPPTRQEIISHAKYEMKAADADSFYGMR